MKGFIVISAKLIGYNNASPDDSEHQIMQVTLFITMSRQMTKNMRYARTFYNNASWIISLTSREIEENTRTLFTTYM